jgi:hypothetical protein
MPSESSGPCRLPRLGRRSIVAIIPEGRTFREIHLIWEISDAAASEEGVMPQMERAALDSVELEYEVSGDGEPVVFIHGAFIADVFRPLLAEPGLAGRYRLILYHRRGYGSSSRTSGPVSVSHRPPTAGLCYAIWTWNGRMSWGTHTAAASHSSWHWIPPGWPTRWPCWSHRPYRKGQAAAPFNQGAHRLTSPQGRGQAKLVWTVRRFASS